MGNSHSSETQKIVVVQPIKLANQGNKVVAVSVQPTVQTTTTPPSQQYNFKSLVECVNESLLGVGPWIRKQKYQFSDSQLVKTCRNNKQSFKQQVMSPLCQLYTNIPEKLTDAKFQLIGPYNYNQRFTALNILCALAAIGTITATSKINPVNRVLRTVRNAAFLYMVGGLFIAPEIYNPFIRY